MDQHADIGGHDEGHRLTHCQKNCRNALHTAKYCTSRPREERGSSKIFEDISIIARSCKVGKKMRIFKI